MSVLKYSAATFAVIAAAAVAQPDSGSGGSATNRNESVKTNEKGEQVICRLVRNPDTDSLVRGRVQLCLTAEQWRRRRT